MSNRKTLTDTLRRLNAGTLPELAEATGWPERKVRDTLGDLKTAGLVQFERDDVTGKPLYRLTKAGATWQPPKTGRPTKSSCDTPAGGGDISPAPRDPEPPKEIASPEARGVVEPPVRAQKPASARSDEIERMHVAIAEFCLWLHEKVGGERAPINLPECARIIERRLAEGEERIATLESNAELPLITRSAPARYRKVMGDEWVKTWEIARRLDTTPSVPQKALTRWLKEGLIERRKADKGYEWRLK